MENCVFILFICCGTCSCRYGSQSPKFRQGELKCVKTVDDIAFIHVYLKLLFNCESVYLMYSELIVTSTYRMHFSPLVSRITHNNQVPFSKYLFLNDDGV